MIFMNICTDMVDFYRCGHNCKILHLAYKLIATVAENIGPPIHPNIYQWTPG